MADNGCFQKMNEFYSLIYLWKWWTRANVGIWLAVIFFRDLQLTPFWPFGFAIIRHLLYAAYAPPP